MNMKKALSIIILILSINVTFGITTQQQANLDKYSKQVIPYLENKYHKKFVLYREQMSPSNKKLPYQFVIRDSSGMLFTSFYDIQSNEFVDSYQSYYLATKLVNQYIQKANLREYFTDKAIFGLYSSKNSSKLIFSNAYKKDDLQILFNEAKNDKVGFKLIAAVNMEYSPRNLLSLFNQVSKLNNYLAKNNVKGIDIDIAVFDIPGKIFNNSIITNNIGYSYYFLRSFGARPYDMLLKKHDFNKEIAKQLNKSRKGELVSIVGFGKSQDFSSPMKVANYYYQGLASLSKKDNKDFLASNFYKQMEKISLKN
ncbi:hypothetical protein F7310_02495 [Francisella uliginis]|uniref:Uncharacterized protein n=2 Tax=Francisella uliginis TaxID=573570 RepID=A0A1L4BR32_9GAMM|nr:hypothetical protein F7310_02495 [Francisella uliginis]